MNPRNLLRLLSTGLIFAAAVAIYAQRHPKPAKEVQRRELQKRVDLIVL